MTNTIQRKSEEMEVLITGGTGFIGNFLIRELKNQGYNLTCLVRKNSNINELKKLDINFVYGDIQNKESLHEAVAGKDVIYHLVGIGSLSANSEEEFKKFHDTNVSGTRNILDVVVSINPNISKIIYLSSTAAVGLQKGIVTEKTICNPISPYQRSKYDSERLILDYYEQYKLPITVLRPCMVYGPGNQKSEILHMCKFIKKGIYPLFNDGNNSVPLVHVSDLVQGIILASKNGRDGEIYFMTNDEISTMNKLIDTISKAMDKKVFKIIIPKKFAKSCTYILENVASILKFKPIITRERIDSMTENRVFSVNKAKKELGYKPNINVDDGLKETVEWYQHHGYL